MEDTPNWKKPKWKKNKQLKETAAKAVAVAAAVHPARAKPGVPVDAQLDEAAKSHVTAAQMTLAKVVPAVSQTQLLGQKTLAVAKFIREAEADRASDIALVDSDKEHGEKVLQTLHGLETFETICAAVAPA